MKESFDVDKQLTSTQIRTANENFWRNLMALNAFYNRSVSQNNERLRELQQHMQDIELLWLNLLREKHRNKKAIAEQERKLIAIKERAIQLVTPNFASCSMVERSHIARFTAIKREFLIYLHDPVFKSEDLAALHKEIAYLTCDQMLSEIDEFFDASHELPQYRVASFHKFVETVERRKLIPKEKPWAICFDKRRAFELFHEVQTRAVMQGIADSEKLFAELMRAKINYASLDRFNPMKTGKTPVTCHGEFNRYFFEELTLFENQFRDLETEYVRVEDQKPFVLWSPFYVTTEKAINVWQYELLVRQFKVLEYVAHYLKTRADDLNAWLIELNNRGVLSQSLVKQFRDSLLQTVLEKNESLKMLCEKTYKRLQEKEEHKLTQNNAVMTSLEETLQATKRQLTELQTLPLGTVEGLQFFTTASSEAQKNQELWKERFKSGKQIPEAVLDQWVLRLEEDPEIFNFWDRESVLALQRIVAEKMRCSLEEMSKESAYIKQVIRFFLALKKDSILTQFKKGIDSLPTVLRRSPLMRHCAQSIGRTVSERLKKIEQVICQTERQIATILAELTHLGSMSKTLEGSLLRLMAYVQNHFVRSIEQLQEEQKEEIKTLGYFIPPKGMKFNIAQILDNLIFLSEKYYVLTEYHKASDQIFELHQKDEYVSEEILPLPQEDVLLASQVCPSVSSSSSASSEQGSLEGTVFDFDSDCQSLSLTF